MVCYHLPKNMLYLRTTPYPTTYYVATIQHPMTSLAVLTSENETFLLELKESLLMRDKLYLKRSITSPPL